MRFRLPLYWGSSVLLVRPFALLDDIDAVSLLQHGVRRSARAGPSETSRDLSEDAWLDGLRQNVATILDYNESPLRKDGTEAGSSSLSNKPAKTVKQGTSASTDDLHEQHDMPTATISKSTTELPFARSSASASLSQQQIADNFMRILGQGFGKLKDSGQQARGQNASQNSTLEEHVGNSAADLKPAKDDHLVDSAADLKLAEGLTSSTPDARSQLASVDLEASGARREDAQVKEAGQRKHSVVPMAKTKTQVKQANHVEPHDSGELGAAGGHDSKDDVAIDTAQEIRNILKSIRQDDANWGADVNSVASEDRKSTPSHVEVTKKTFEQVNNATAPASGEQSSSAVHESDRMHPDVSEVETKVYPRAEDALSWPSEWKNSNTAGGEVSKASETQANVDTGMSSAETGDRDLAAIAGSWLAQGGTRWRVDQDGLATTDVGSVRIRKLRSLPDGSAKIAFGETGYETLIGLNSSQVLRWRRDDETVTAWTRSNIPAANSQASQQSQDSAKGPESAEKPSLPPAVPADQTLSQESMTEEKDRQIYDEHQESFDLKERSTMGGVSQSPDTDPESAHQHRDEAPSKEAQIVGEVLMAEHSIPRKLFDHHHGAHTAEASPDSSSEQSSLVSHASPHDHEAALVADSLPATGRNLAARKEPEAAESGAVGLGERVLVRDDGDYRGWLLGIVARTSPVMVRPLPDSEAAPKSWDYVYKLPEIPHQSEQDDVLTAVEGRINQGGYQKVADMHNTTRMAAFITMAVAANGGVVKDQAALMGFAPYHSGERGIQSYKRLLEGLKGENWTTVGDALKPDEDLGAHATLDEAGYKELASTGDSTKMTVFIQRLVKAYAGHVKSVEHLQTFAEHFSGERAGQSFDRLVAQLRKVPWVGDMAMPERRMKPDRRMKVVEGRAAATDVKP